MNPYDQQWYKFDDQRVNVVPSDGVQEEIVNNEAYILFYQRRKVDSAECSGSNSSSSEHWLSKMPIPSNPCTSTTTISSEMKKKDVEKIPEISEEYEEEITATHPSKDIQTDEIPSQQNVEGIKETAALENCSSNDESSVVVSLADMPIEVEPTNGDEIIDVETVEIEKRSEQTPSDSSTSKSMSAHKEEKEGTTTSPIENEDKNEIAIDSFGNDIDIDIDIEVGLRNLTVKKSEGALSVSFPTQRSLWPFENHHDTIHSYTPILTRGSLNFNELLSSERNAHLRHSLSTSLSHQRSSNSDKAKLINVTANDTLAMVRGVSSCSKDTLIYIDQQSDHRSLIDEETNFLANQPLWVNV